MAGGIAGKLNSIAQFLKEVKAELKKVSWSTREELKDSTTIVLIAVVILAAVIGIFDVGMSKLVDILIK